MRFILEGTLALFVCLLLCNCAINKRKTTESLKESAIPKFRDNGKAVDSLKSVYRFESVEYEKWEEDDMTDSTLTVCFINSKKLPLRDTNGSVNEFKAIASAIHQSVLDQYKYKSYYIIFVTREKSGFLLSTDSHTAGMDVPVRIL